MSADRQAAAFIDRRAAAALVELGGRPSGRLTGLSVIGYVSP